MTQLFDQAVETVRALPSATQDDVARFLMQFVGDDANPLQLTPEEEASFDESLAQSARGEFASDEQMRAIWAKVR